jgi:hypothetical protein
MIPDTFFQYLAHKILSLLHGDFKVPLLGQVEVYQGPAWLIGRVFPTL